MEELLTVLYTGGWGAMQVYDFESLLERVFLSRFYGFGHLWCPQPLLSLFDQAKMIGVRRHQRIGNDHVQTWNLEKRRWKNLNV